MDDEKLLKMGLGVGKGDLRAEGSFHMGWTRRCRKRCSRGPEADLLLPPEPPDAPES